MRRNPARQPYRHPSDLLRHPQGPLRVMPVSQNWAPNSGCAYCTGRMSHLAGPAPYN